MNLPSFASLRPANLTAAAISGVGSARPPYISIDGNVFSLVDSTGNKKQLPPMILNGAQGQYAAVAIDVVFIDANPKPSKLYWDPAKPYQPGSVEPPLCWSDNGVGPSDQAAQPQSPTCMSCEHNKIGSAISKFSGAAIRACGDSKKLACIIPGDPDGMIYLLQIKPGSESKTFNNWKTHINWLRGQKKLDGGIPELYDVITRITFVAQGTLQFEPVAAVEELSPLGAQMIEAWSKKITGSMIGLDDRPIDPQTMLRPPTQGGQLPPPPQSFAQPAAFSAPQQAAPFPTGTNGHMTAPSNQIHGHMPAAVDPPVRKRRTKAEMEAARAAAPAYPAGYSGQNPAAPPFVSGLQQAPAQGAPVIPPFTLDHRTGAIAPVDPAIPPFLQRAPAPSAPAAPPASSGLATPQTPSDDLKAKLAAAFALPTGK